MFCYIGGFSGGSGPLVLGNQKLDVKTAFHGALADPAAFAKKVHLLRVGVGTEELAIPPTSDMAKRTCHQARLLFCTL